MILDVIERIITISGEAPAAGVPCYLIRFSGCNLRCPYCDTPGKDKTTQTLTSDELYRDIIQRLSHYPALKILFTGGEPLLGERQRLLYDIINRCKGSTDFYIETNGSIPIKQFPGHTHFVCDWKTPSSGEEKKFVSENLKLLRPEADCIKFVLAKKDFPWVKDALKRIHKENPRLPVYFSPQWRNLNHKDLAEFILTHRLPVMMSLQLHKIIWKDEKEGIKG